MLTVTGVCNYHGVIQKGTNYRIISEGRDFYRLANLIYIPKFTVGPVIEEDEEDYEYFNFNEDNTANKYKGKQNSTRNPSFTKKSISGNKNIYRNKFKPKNKSNKGF